MPSGLHDRASDRQKQAWADRLIRYLETPVTRSAMHVLQAFTDDLHIEDANEVCGMLRERVSDDLEGQVDKLEEHLQLQAFWMASFSCLMKIDEALRSKTVDPELLRDQITQWHRSMPVYVSEWLETLPEEVPWPRKALVGPWDSQ
jgi:hypothetical protein